MHYSRALIKLSAQINKLELHMIYNANKSQLSHVDWESLNNMAQITVDDVVDINVNGTVGKPYSVNLNEWKGLFSLTTRKFYQVLGASSTKHDVPQIQKLIDRVISAHMRGGEVIETLSDSLKGLSNLKLHYEKDGFKETTTQIGEIIKKVEDFLNNQEEFKLENFYNNGFFKRMNLEASIIGDESGKIGEGTLLYSQKIDLFLTSQREAITESDRIFLEKLKNSLNNSNHFETVSSSFYYAAAEKARLNYPTESNDPELWKQVYEVALKDLAEEKIRSLFSELEKMNEADQSELGIGIPMNVEYGQDRSGHAFFLSLCKEKDGSFTVAQINTGVFMLSEPEICIQLNRNIHAPISYSASPVVEFSGLSHEEAELFLKKALVLNGRDFFTRIEAGKNYSGLFADILDKKTLNRIPARRLQITGNCVTRSAKEYLVYCFQKSKNIELGNKFLSYLDPRDSTTLSLEAIRQLKE